MNRAIAVFGAASADMAPIFYRDARAVGRRIAEAGCAMVFGGGDAGMMGACARGAHEGGGRVIGVIPNRLNEPGIAYETCDQLIVTRDLRDRMETMERLADAFIALPGGIGTLYELFEVLTLNQLGYIKKRVAVLNTARYYDPFANIMEAMYREKCAGAACRSLYALSDAPEWAVRYALGE
ncbi:MAG: TIGR00730 family Rossman fold protein [Clostridiales bacterium]|nr:TIGR00730 family Rossman fold protein [Clostridiales bacterium]